MGNISSGGSGTASSRKCKKQSYIKEVEQEFENDISRCSEIWAEVIQDIEIRDPLFLGEWGSQIGAGAHGKVFVVEGVDGMYGRSALVTN